MSLLHEATRQERKHCTKQLRRRSRHRFTTVTAAVKCHDLHLLDSRSRTRRFIQCARHSARALLKPWSRALAWKRSASDLQTIVNVAKRPRSTYSSAFVAQMSTALRRTYTCVFSPTTHMCVPCTYIRVLPRTHMSVFSHTHAGVSPSAARERPLTQACRNDEICE